jgi:hypothetical protein
VTIALTLTAPPSSVLSLPEPSAREREHVLVVAAQRGDTESCGAQVRLHQRRADAVARAIVVSHE